MGLARKKVALASFLAALVALSVMVPTVDAAQYGALGGQGEQSGRMQVPVNNAAAGADMYWSGPSSVIEDTPFNLQVGMTGTAAVIASVFSVLPDIFVDAGCSITSTVTGNSLTGSWRRSIITPSAGAEYCSGTYRVIMGAAVGPQIGSWVVAWNVQVVSNDHVQQIAGDLDVAVSGDLDVAVSGALDVAADVAITSWPTLVLDLDGSDLMFDCDNCSFEGSTAFDEWLPLLFWTTLTLFFLTRRPAAYVPAVPSGIMLVVTAAPGTVPFATLIWGVVGVLVGIFLHIFSKNGFTFAGEDKEQ